MRRKPVILCVHPQLATVQPMLALLYEGGCDVLAAEDHLSASRILQSEAVDVVLLDHNFDASSDGEFLTAELGKLSPGMPIVLVADDESLRQRFTSGGNTIQVTTSTDPNAVLEIIEKLAARKKRSKAS